jgi:GT2 family glycosyltransferase
MGLKIIVLKYGGTHKTHFVILNLKFFAKALLSKSIILVSFESQKNFFFVKVLFNILRRINPNFKFSILCIRSMVLLDNNGILIESNTPGSQSLKYFDSIVVAKDRTAWYESRPLWSPLLYRQLDYIGEVVVIENIDASKFIVSLVSSFESLVRDNIDNQVVRIPNSGYFIDEINWIPLQNKRENSLDNLRKLDSLEGSLTIIIPTRFTKNKNIYFLEECLNSIAKCIDVKYISKILLVHENEHASEFDKIAENFDGIKVKSLKYSGKFNFSQVLNDGIKQTLTRYVVILNDDIFFRDIVDVEHIVRHLEEDKVDIIGFNLVYPNSFVLQHAGLEYRNREPQHYLKGTLISVLDKIHNPCRETSGTTGALLFMLKETIDKYGYFDEDFPNDYGDVEYMIRVNSRGGKVIICSATGIHHFESISRGNTDLNELNLNLQRLVDKCGELPDRDEYLFTPFDFER